MIRRVLDARDGPRYLFEHVLGPATRESVRGAANPPVRADGGADLLVSHQIPVIAPIVAEVTGIRWVSGARRSRSGSCRPFDPPTPPQAPWLRPLLALHPSIAGVANRIAAPGDRALDAADRAVSRGARPAAGPGARSSKGSTRPGWCSRSSRACSGRNSRTIPPQTVVAGFPFYDAAQPQRPGLAGPAAVSRRWRAAGAVFTLGSSAVWIAGDFYSASIQAIPGDGETCAAARGRRHRSALRNKGLPPGIAAFPTTRRTAW